MKHEVSL